MEEVVGRTATIAFRVNRAEREAVEALASRAACRPSEYVRSIVRRDLQSHGLLGAPANMAEDNSGTPANN